MALLQYDFRTVGADRLPAILSRHRAIVRSHNRQMAREAEAIATGGARGTGGGVAAYAARTRAADREVARRRSVMAAQERADSARLSSERLRGASKLQQRLADSSTRAQTAQQRGVEATTRTQEAASKRASVAAERLALREQRAREGARLREERTVATEQKRTQRYWESAARRSADMRLRGEERATQMAAARARSTGQQRYGAIAGVGGRIGGALGTMAKIGVGLAAVGGGISLAEAVSGKLERVRTAAQLATQAGAPERTAEVEKKAADVRGFSTGAVLEGLERWQTMTGELDLGMKQLQDWADLADATSAEFGDISQASGTLWNSFAATIPDADARLAAITETMRAMAAQGAKGSIEVKDLATRIGEMWQGAAKFGDDPVKQMRQMGAVAQIFKGAAGLSIDEAMTTIQRMPDDIIQSLGKFEAAGIDVWMPGQKGFRMKEIPDLLADVMAKTGGRIDKIMKLGFDVRSKRGVEQLALVYSEAEKRQKGTGRSAMMARIAEFEDLTVGPQRISQLAEGRREQADKKFMERRRAFMSAIGEAALPELDKLQAELVKLAPSMAKATTMMLRLVNAFAEEPWRGLGLIISAVVAKEIAGAAIGVAIKQSLTSMLTPAATGAATSLTGVASSGAGAHSALARLAIAGVAIGAVGLAYDQSLRAGAEITNMVTADEQAIDEAVKSGRLTPEQALEAEQRSKSKNRMFREKLGQAIGGGLTLAHAGMGGFVATKALGMFGVDIQKSLGEFLVNRLADDIGPGRSIDYFEKFAPPEMAPPPATAEMVAGRFQQKGLMPDLGTTSMFARGEGFMMPEMTPEEKAFQAQDEANTKLVDAAKKLDGAGDKLVKFAESAVGGRNPYLNRGDQPSPGTP